jgi:hypothetical protein
LALLLAAAFGQLSPDASKSNKIQCVNGKAKIGGRGRVALRLAALGWSRVRAMIQEIAMAALVIHTRLRLVRWFKEFSAKNRPPHRWYEHDHYGI